MKAMRAFKKAAADRHPPEMPDPLDNGILIDMAWQDDDDDIGAVLGKRIGNFC